MKVGDYVRTREGKIIKVKSYDEETNNPLFETLNGVVQMKEKIVKSSPNIIDLIEVGDYVNGYKIGYVNNLTKQFYWEDEDFEGKGHDAKYIYSIVTKEQFKEMEYRIGDD